MEESSGIYAHVHEYVPTQQLCFSTSLYSEGEKHYLIQGIVIDINLWNYKDPHSSVVETDMWEGAYKRWNDDFPM